jgi:predicted 2-oxoglutarate/Fe(II)-dependent dioxygenase YbiX
MTFVEEADGLLSVQLFDDAECRVLLEHVVEADGWCDASIRLQGAAGRPVDVRSSEARVASVLSLCEVPDVQRRFDAQVDALIKPLVACYWNVDLRDHDGSQIVRYGVGGHYGPHDDVGDTCRERQFSVVCYLNDEFQGGGTRFPDLSCTIVPRRGKAIVFPARYLHSAARVDRGEKYVAVSWVIEPAP